MTDEAPVTTRVGGGASARAAVAIVVVGLAAIVGAAFVNRPPPPPPAAHLALAPVATPSVATGSVPLPTDAPLPRRSLRGVNLGEDAFAVIALIAGRQYPIVLRSGGENFLDGWARLPYPRADATGTIELAQLWSRDSSRNFQSIGRWSLPLDLLMPELRASGTVLTISETARALTGDNRLVHDGFRLEVRLESRSAYGVIFVSVHTPYCGETGGTACNDPPDGEPHRRVYGEDGIFGLPGWPWRADDSGAASPTLVPSRYVFNWLGRYWPGPGQKLTR